MKAVENLLKLFGALFGLLRALFLVFVIALAFPFIYLINQLPSEWIVLKGALVIGVVIGVIFGLVALTDHKIRRKAHIVSILAAVFTAVICYVGYYMGGYGLDLSHSKSTEIFGAFLFIFTILGSLLTWVASLFYVYHYVEYGRLR